MLICINLRNMFYHTNPWRWDIRMTQKHYGFKLQMVNIKKFDIHGRTFFLTHGGKSFISCSKWEVSVCGLLFCTATPGTSSWNLWAFQKGSGVITVTYFHETKHILDGAIPITEVTKKMEEKLNLAQAYLTLGPNRVITKWCTGA